jgi:hypothetical protein
MGLIGSVDREGSPYVGELEAGVNRRGAASPIGRTMKRLREVSLDADDVLFVFSRLRQVRVSRAARVRVV